MDLSDQEMVNPSKNENAGFKAHSERNDKIGLESALPKNWGLRRTLKKDGWPTKVKNNDGLIVMGDLPRKYNEDGLVVMGDLPRWEWWRWSHCNGWPT